MRAWMALLLCAGAAEGKSKRAKADRRWKAQRSRCLKNDCGLLPRAAQENCANACTSLRCFNEVYREQPLEDGEIDIARKNAFTKCARAEYKSGKKPRQGAPAPANGTGTEVGAGAGAGGTVQDWVRHRESPDDDPGARYGCSRRLSRAFGEMVARDVFSRVWGPFDAQRDLPKHCVLHPENHMFAPQDAAVEHVSRAGKDESRCGICGKHFAGDFYLLRHLDHRHPLDTASVNCNAHHCHVFGGCGDAPGDGEYADAAAEISAKLPHSSCRSGEMEKLRAQCRAILHGCFPVDHHGGAGAHGVEEGGEGQLGAALANGSLADDGGFWANLAAESLRGSGEQRRFDARNIASIVAEVCDTMRCEHGVIKRDVREPSRDDEGASVPAWRKVLMVVAVVLAVVYWAVNAAAALPGLLYREQSHSAFGRLLGRTTHRQFDIANRERVDGTYRQLRRLLWRRPTHAVELIAQFLAVRTDRGAQAEPAFGDRYVGARTDDAPRSGLRRRSAPNGRQP